MYITAIYTCDVHLHDLVIQEGMPFSKKAMFLFCFCFHKNNPWTSNDIFQDRKSVNYFLVNMR